nr:VQ motif-containing protein 22-like [Ipomoea batatas]GMC89500.1 VQ motif-containing protein 22-like [Ipomoea batatas]
MAMSETMPPGGPTDWAQFYQHNLAHAPPQQQQQTDFFGGGRVSESTVVTTTVTSPTAAPSLGQLSPEGRVSKPARRRTRASRRTPTTVLNTDTSNFRAMVQQFTGGPALAQQAQYPIPSGSNLNFGFGLSSNLAHHQHLVNPTPARTTGGYQLQFQPPHGVGAGNYMLASSNQQRDGGGGGGFLRRPTGAMGLGISTSDDHSFPLHTHRGSSSSSGNETNNYMF